MPCIESHSRQSFMLIALFFFCFVFFPWSSSSRVSPSEPVDQGCDGDEEQRTDPRNTEETLLNDTETHVPHSQTDSQVCAKTFFVFLAPPQPRVTVTGTQ